jgi:5-methylcytosine-specific restriction endonuclease McrA
VARVSAVYCSRRCKEKAQTLYPPKKCAICRKVFKSSNGKRHETKCKTCPNPRCRTAWKTGKRNPNWRGGVTKGRKERSTKPYKAWRRAVFERDDYTCQNSDCGKRGGDLHADHIKPWAYFPALRYDVANGRTLCVPCHRKTYKEVFTWRGCA